MPYNIKLSFKIICTELSLLLILHRNQKTTVQGRQSTGKPEKRTKFNCLSESKLLFLG